MLKRLYQPYKLTSTFLLGLQVPFQGRRKGRVWKGRVKRLPEAGAQVTWWVFLWRQGKKVGAGVRGWCFKRAQLEITNLIERGLTCFLDGKSLTITRPNIPNTQGRDFLGGGG